MGKASRVWQKSALLFLLLTSCSSPFPRWKIETVHPCGNSRLVKATYPSCNPFQEAEIEWRQDASGIRLFLNVYGIALEEDPSFPETIAVYLTIEEQNETHYAHLLQGRQRALLSPESTEIILQALKEGCHITLTIGPYRAAIYSSPRLRALFCR